jgi:pimeloyl-ACP methyl ester carboxylesterase
MQVKRQSRLGDAAYVRERRATGCVRVAVLAALVASCEASSATQPTSCDGDNVVRGGSDCLYVETFKSASLSDQPTLVVVLHGDAPFNNPDYHYQWARAVSLENTDVIAAGILRPGYSDPSGHRSTGTRGEAVGDNYTPAVVDAIAGAVTVLRARFKPAHVMLAGHSGGAAIAAGVMGRHPGVANGALLVACPCDVPRWREHMKETTQGRIWDTPVNAVSPVEVVDSIDPQSRFVVIVGEQDDVAPPQLTREYRDRLQGRRLSVTYIEVPGAGHEIFDHPLVHRAASDLLKTLR